MAPIKPSDQRFRTKQELARDIAFILAAPVAFGTQAAVIDNALWAWTDMGGKYMGCPFWTKMAFLRYLEHRHTK